MPNAQSKPKGTNVEAADIVVEDVVAVADVEDTGDVEDVAGVATHTTHPTLPIIIKLKR